MPARSAPDAGLYLHIPFCARVCPYCDFAVRTGDAARRRRFVDHLIAEIALYAGYDLRFDTIYFGGGTPSLLAPEDLVRIVASAREHLRFAQDTRIFLEANPEDATAERLADWRALGVATLSLGVQSFDDAALDFLGRRHDAAGAVGAIERAAETGFSTVSIDLIYGLPESDDAAWHAQLERAVALGVDHVSCYQLTIHRGTRFGLLHARGRLTELPDERQADVFRSTHRLLNDRGMQGYEVSQFARDPAHRSRHNMKYWNHTPYLGLGPSAHSYRDDRRWWNLRRTDPYQDSVAAGTAPVEETERLDARALVLEALMTGFRTYAGVDLDAIHRRFDVDLAATNAARIAQLAKSRLVEVDGPRLVPTLDGLAVADTLALRLEIP